MKPVVTTSRRLLPLAVGLIVVLALLPKHFGDWYGPPLRDTLSRVLYPLTMPLTIFGNRLHQQFDKPPVITNDLHRLSDELRQRDGRILQLERRVRELELVVTELEGLRKRLGFSYKFRSARVIGRSSDIAAKTLTIQLGSSDGVEPGQAAVENGNIVGRVVQVGVKTSIVLPLTAMDSFIEVLVVPPTLTGGRLPAERRRTIQVKPRSAGLLVAEDVDKTVPIAIGDYARLDDRGPEGWPAAVQGMIVGVVHSVMPHPDDPLRQRVEIRPLFPVAALESVTVIVPEATER